LVPNEKTMPQTLVVSIDNPIVFYERGKKTMLIYLKKSLNHVIKRENHNVG
jgi:hypothetical protein